MGNDGSRGVNGGRSAKYETYLNYLEPMLPLCRLCAVKLTLALFLTAVLPSGAVVFYDTSDPLHNSETAPGGALAGSGWQFQGEFGDFLGTMISPNHFITAAHFGVPSSTFVSRGHFNGASDVTYNINTTANGGTGFWSIGGTDLVIYEVFGSFSSYAPLYTGSDEVGKDLVVMGRGTQRGATVDLSSVQKGWGWGASDNKARWGTNTVSEISTFGGVPYLRAAFDALPGTDEAHLTVGDSGGALFISDDGIWKLAGINYAVDGDWDYNGLADGNGFNASLFDAGGLYVGSDATSWTLVPDETADVPSGFYSTRISTYVSQIQSVTGVPEPGLMSILMLGAGLLLRRRRVI